MSEQNAHYLAVFYDWASDLHVKKNPLCSNKYDRAENQ